MQLAIGDDGSRLIRRIALALAGGLWLTATSNTYPLIFVVIGQQSAIPLGPLYRAGVRTRAGRRPACSCPAWGSK